MKVTSARFAVAAVLAVLAGQLPVARATAEAYPQYQVSVVSPAVGTTVWGNTMIKFYAPGMKNVFARAWHQPDATHTDPAGFEAWFQNVIPDANGYGEITFPAASYPYGPAIIRISAWDSGPGDPDYAHSDEYFLQIFNAVGVTFRKGVPSSPPPGAAGKSLAYVDDFTGPLSISRTGAGTTYAALKPDPSEPTGGGEFGDAIFADPAGPYNPFSIRGGHYLRIRSVKTPNGYVDPRGWNRTHFGGLLSSLRLDGTGFAAKYGYFEARMLAPQGKGTWPAFWLLPQDIIAEHDPNKVAVEIDTVELYGHTPQTACHSYHVWKTTPAVHDSSCAKKFTVGGDTSATWHTYATNVTPTDTVYYIDDVEVWRHTTVERGRTPMFFMINLALGGGWPIDLARYHDQADLYVDYVRVYA